MIDQAVAKFLRTLDVDELLLYVCVALPEEVRRQVLERRAEIALKMLERGKVSVGMAAKLAGIPINEMVKLAVKRGLKPFAG